MSGLRLSLRHPAGTQNAAQALISYCMAVVCECWLGGGNDGPDDGAENGLNWTLAHMLGADEKVLEMWRIGWEGHLRQ